MLNGKNFQSPKESEEAVLKFWRENKIFEKSVNKKSKRGDFSFYDGPPFATGLPHYGHILASVIKDAIPRYQTMKGFRVKRRWGWDCHGLPVEYELEKELNLKTKKDIENFGVKNFNERAKSFVLKYTDEWKRIIPRIGRWADMENDYKTMDWHYTESIWWVFKKLYDKNLIYEGYKSMHICPRCETTLANFEVSQGYKEITDISITAKFKLAEEKNTFVLAWTTTPWTLPGNAALAINPKINYAKIKSENGEIYILAKNRIESLAPNQKVLEIFSGKKLIGKKYEPLFKYYLDDKNLKNKENGWKIYPADFVTIDEGTGVVHIAPAFGEDDMNLSQKHNLPFIQHVSMNGKFKKEVKNFAGFNVKPRENPQSTDIEIIKWLSANNKLFSKQKIIHSYPHCWRCDTPLLNYAANSWFVRVAAIKDKIIKNNKKIKWIPAHIKTGRFGKIIETAPDWGISRSRFWGAPLPVWKCESCEKQMVIGSVEEIKNNSQKSRNNYFIMRHGEAESNVKNEVSSDLKLNTKNHLTKNGVSQVKKSAKKLKKIDAVFSSDFERTKETANIIAKEIGYKKKIIFDKRLREINAGIFNGGLAKEYRGFFRSTEERFYKAPPKGESLNDLKKRISEFLYEIDKKYSGKNILIISHDDPIFCLFASAKGTTPKEAAEMKTKNDFIKTGEVMKLDFIPLPHNSNYELDLHRPYIDEIKLICDCGKKTERIKDVFDCWFESGSMPYAQIHYPFENKNDFNKNFPAQFIAEGLDQTRGWFYSLLVLSTALFNKPAYKNVIVNGTILAENGEKISKRLKNYSDPMEMVDKYGADSIRYYLLSSPVVRAEDLNFSEQGVDEIYKKVVSRLWNVYKFYELYSGETKIKNKKLKTENVLDIWVTERLEVLKKDVSLAMDAYELDKALRPITEFIEDLSTWYIRRSRERFKSEDKKDKQNAINTTGFILTELSKIMAPFTPFISELIYKSLNNKESVHLENWPIAIAQNQKSKIKNQKLLEGMKEVRRITSLALEARQKAGIKIRQPLQRLKVKSAGWRIKLKVDKELLGVLADEINVKEIIFNEKINPPDGGEIELDTTITPQLKEEGITRDIIRMVQGLRKEAGYIYKDKIHLWILLPEEREKAVLHNIEYFKKEINADDIEFKKSDKFEAETETNIDGQKIWLGIKKL